MEQIKTISKRCLSIQPDNTIKSIVLIFDHNFARSNKASNFQIVWDNLKHKYKCSYYHLNVLNATFPDHTYYSLFYECPAELRGRKYNKIASKMINENCYGECIVVHFDTFNDLCDIDRNTFIELYNGKHENSQIYVQETNDFINQGLNSGCKFCIIS